MLPPDTIRAVEKRAKCLHSLKEVELALDKMATQIKADLSESNPIVLCVMIGGVVPTGMLLTRLDFPLQVDYVHATRYGMNMSGGDQLEWLVRPRVPLKDRTVLIVDDILDGGETLAGIIDFCKAEGAADVRAVALVEKIRERPAHALQKAHYTGVEVENLFVYGFGMDYKRYLRNAPGIYAVSSEDE